MFFRKKKYEKQIPSVSEIYENAIRIMNERATGYSIRCAEESDLERVRDINYKSLPENYPISFFYELWSRYGKAFHVAVSPNNEIVGYVMCRVEHKPGFYKKLLVKSGHIVSIAVLENHRRKGLGYCLMAYAMNSLLNNYNCDETYLEVRVSNKPAISLYERLGYSIERIEKYYYLDGEDAYVMARPLF